MGVENINTFIGSFGFPIFACIAMGWYINTTQKELIKVMSDVNSTLKGIMARLGMEDKDDE